MKRNNRNVQKKRHDSKSRREQILILSRRVVSINPIQFFESLNFVPPAYVRQKFRIHQTHSHFLQCNQIKASDEGDNTNFVVSLFSSNGTFLDQKPYLPQSILREEFESTKSFAPLWFDSNEKNRNKSATWLRRTSPYRKTYV